VPDGLISDASPEKGGGLEITNWGRMSGIGRLRRAREGRRRHQKRYPSGEPGFK